MKKILDTSKGIKLPKPLLIFDVEATGSDTTKYDICEIGAILTNKYFDYVSEFSSLVKPLSSLRDEEAMQVHNIPEADLDNAPELSQVLTELEKFILNSLKYDLNINTPYLELIMLSSWSYFDMDFLVKSYNKVHREFPYNMKHLDLKSIAMWQVSRLNKGMTGGVKKFTQMLGLVPFKFHSALDDAKMEFNIVKYLANMEI